MELGDSLPDLVVVFISAAYGEEIRPAMESLNEIAPSRYLLGTTAEAVLANNDEYESEPAIAIWMAKLPNAEIIPLTLEYSQTADGGTFLGWPTYLWEYARVLAPVHNYKENIVFAWTRCIFSWAGASSIARKVNFIHF